MHPRPQTVVDVPTFRVGGVGIVVGGGYGGGYPPWSRPPVIVVILSVGIGVRGIVLGGQKVRVGILGPR